MSNVQSLIGQHFAYAHGRTGVLQQLLLSQSDVDRLLGAPDGKATEQILTELKMTSIIDQGIREGNAVLQAVAGWIRSEVEQMSPLAKQPIFSILWLEGDAPLLAYLLKEAHGLTSEIAQEPVSGMSAYAPDSLRALVRERIEGDLPSHLTSFVSEVLATDGINARSIDTKVAQFIANTSLALAKTSGSPLIRKYVRRNIDLQNIRTALRLADEDRDESLFYMLNGGSISASDLAGPLSSIVTAVGKSELGYLLSDVLQSNEDKNALERKLSEVIAAVIADMWNVPLSIEPVFAFAAIGISQLKLLRMILIGKRNGLSPQDIKRALPPFLSATHYLS
ncbi:hypothetical protein COU78_00115 [Candidatus Peregrinibacteria bacterium CG10_big_fil_rev_8_21_14_0_10_49_24]|nr:MAG: hypothetical protein COV83_06160 [Candidatus Peregrinibacteria bacterium CG11_big_fil_rev_8_21_14_0_20_49_14]PIR51593.1 MAG: hypothetical protein COU78_00115 [Candidatus Peregrinibacteria bacterium CG10_big_fil_rev_8_21_14_0_10_49_24]PJA68045.1 MAG: hypothetical protein CO157_01850 [Candidatus Peregrinibacteria bacterium CG_4_9_14_3_um_filter_49_12]